MSYCYGCGYVINVNADGYCWQCNDSHILDKYHKPDIREELKAKAQKYYDAMTEEQKEHSRKMRENDNNLSPVVQGLNRISEEWRKRLHADPQFNAMIDSLKEYEDNQSRQTTLPTDSAERKNYPLFRGLLKYFPAALAGVSRTSFLGNEKHNPGEEMYHARGKSGDHGDCIIRHLMDTEDLLAAKERGAEVTNQQILDEANQMAWRALAYCQQLHEQLGNAPMAPGAKK